MADVARPGWYPDPAGTPGFRWWDGQDWSETTSPSTDAPAPGGEDPAAVADARRSRPRTLARTVAVLALALAVGAGVLLWRAADRPDAADGGPGATSTPTASVGHGPVDGSLDLDSRTATVDGVSLVLPGDPYAVHADPLRLGKTVQVLFLANAAVHERYDGRRDWSAAVLLAGLGRADPATDPEASARRVLAVLRRSFFDAHDTSISRLRVAAQPVDGRPAVRLTARVHYDVRGLPSRYDRLTLVLVRLDDGTEVVAVSSLPDDADPETVRQADAALRSLSVD